MVDKDIKKEIAILKKIEMTDNEKEEMLKSIFSNPIKSPYMKRVPVFAFIYSHYVRTTLLLGLIFVVSFSSMAYASNYSVPGDLLYPLKVRIMEPAIDVVKSTPEEKVVWEEKKVERRIVEAERLIEKDSLDDDKLAKLEDKIEKSSIAFAEAAGRLASSTATSSFAKIERERKLKQDFRNKINERQATFSNDKGIGDSSSRRDKGQNKEKIERLKRAATRNIADDDGDSADDSGRGGDGDRDNSGNDDE